MPKSQRESSKSLRLRPDQPRHRDGEFIVCDYNTDDGCDPPSERYKCDGKCIIKLKKEIDNGL